ncbi:MAG: radical SAM protein [Alphaproteobacteria bacterium]|jgi:uncharacterized protein|nr:radical SAM protein [Alphaproteobacteria bacterium]
MEKSRFAHAICVRESKFAVFNSILFQPIVMTENEKINLFNGDFSSFSDDDVEELLNVGILVSSKEVDQIVLKNLKTYVENNVGEDVSILYLISTSICNLSCKYCTLTENFSEVRKESMSVKTIENSINKFADHLRKNKKKKGSIVFYGGEPTLNFSSIEKVCEISEGFKDLEFKIIVVTNAVKISDKQIAFFKDRGVIVGVSLDGPKEINDKNRVLNSSELGSYNIVISNLERLKKAGVKLSLSITLSHSFLDNEGILDWIISLGVPGIGYNLLRYNNKNDEWKGYYEKVSEFLFTSHEKLSDAGIREGRILRKINAFYDEKKFKFNDCAAVGGGQLSIKPNGDVIVCQSVWSKAKEICGNINQNTFEDIFASDLYREWRGNLTVNKKECLECSAISICGGGCPEQSEVLFGGRLKVDKTFCIHSKHSLEKLLKEAF